MIETKTPYTVALVPIPMLDIIWSEVECYLQGVVDVAHDEVTLESIKERLYLGKSLLMVIHKGGDILSAILLEIVTFDSGVKALFLPVVGGTEMDEWLDQGLEVVKAIAKDYGCRELRGLAARAGWVKKLRSRGWEEVNIAMRCMLED